MHTNASSKSISWISHIQQTTPPTGQLATCDDAGSPVILAWTAYNPASQKFTQAIKQASEMLIQTYTRQEIEFARKRPEAVSDQMFLKSAAPCFQQGVENVDWTKVEDLVRATMVNFFTQQDFAKWASPDDVTIVMTAKNGNTGEALGVIQFSATPEYAYGTMRVGLIGILSKALNQGLEQLLMSSIFKVVPDVTRLFLHTRATNEQAIAFCQAWGFKSLAGTNADWPDFEYITTESVILQKVADGYNRLD